MHCLSTSQVTCTNSIPGWVWTLKTVKKMLTGHLPVGPVLACAGRVSCGLPEIHCVGFVIAPYTKEPMGMLSSRYVFSWVLLAATDSLQAVLNNWVWSTMQELGHKIFVWAIVVWHPEVGKKYFLCISGRNSSKMSLVTADKERCFRFGK